MMPARSPLRHGMTLFEVLIAMFIFMVGIVGVLAALPTGVTSAEWVIFQDAAIHLSRSKFSEFRRDRINPPIDLKEASTYMVNCQEPPNGSADKFHDFDSKPGSTYQYFDDITRYEWKVVQDPLTKSVGIGAAGAIPTPPADYQVPLLPGVNGTDIGLWHVTIIIRQKGTSRELEFTQYMTDYNRVSPVDPTP
jgi:Tfp pilus assembly protein PilV